MYAFPAASVHSRSRTAHSPSCSTQILKKENIIYHQGNFLVAVEGWCGGMMAYLLSVFVIFLLSWDHQTTGSFAWHPSDSFNPTIAKTSLGPVTKSEERILVKMDKDGKFRRRKRCRKINELRVILAKFQLAANRGALYTHCQNRLQLHYLAEYIKMHLYTFF